MANKGPSRQHEDPSDSNEQTPPRNAGPDSPDEPAFEPIQIKSHRALAAKQEEIARRFQAQPELARMLFVNPVLAFRDVGVELSGELSHHVLHTIRQSASARERRETLDERLTESAGEPPRPDDPAWVAHFLFETLQLQPVEIGKRTPSYRMRSLEKISKRLAERRTTPGQSKYSRRTGSGMSIRIAQPNSLRRLDLDAPVPELPYARSVPKGVSLEDLFFYKDRHSLARDLLELGILQQRNVPVHSGDSYRKIKSGRKSNPLSVWIKAVRFKTEYPDNEP